MKPRPLLLLLALLGGAAPAWAADTVVHTLSGNGARTTRPFEVRDQWEVQWDAQGQLFQVYVLDDAGQIVEMGANQGAPGAGASYVRQGGRYHLQINALGAWTLTVVQIDPKAPVKTIKPQ